MSIPALETFSRRVRIRARDMKADRLRRQAMARPFPPDARARLLLVTLPERIPQSQVFPFHHYARDLRRLHGAEIREADLSGILSGAEVPAKDATVVAFQTAYDIADDDLSRLFERLRADHPRARIGVLDWFAPTDLRNAERMNPHIDFYIKKHLLRDRARYGQPTQGDTNLTDHYSRRFALPEAVQCFPIPPGFMDKLILGPSFATAPGIMPVLLGSPPPPEGRPIDLHARFAVNGTPWYRAMRAEAEAALATLGDLAVVQGQGVNLARFMAELRRSKVCFSPFGYGEVCWRDYEAVMAGAVLLKPGMSHVETDPDIFVAWETYVPVAWDLSDFEATMRRLVGDEALRARIARQAFDLLNGWLRSDAFAQRMTPLFA